MVLFWLPSSIGLGPVQRWGFRKNQIKIDTEKCLISVIWSVNGIHILLDVAKGTTYNNALFCDVVVPDLLGNVRAHNRRQTLKGVWVHVENVRPHNWKKSNECLTQFRVHRVQHPTYSPGIAPSDFFLFGIVETELQNYEIYNRQGLILAIRGIFDEISKDIFNSVYVLCIKRFKWVIKNKGKYFRKWLKNEDFLFECYPEKSHCTNFSTPYKRIPFTLCDFV
jgi:hypothetical protein